MRDHGAPSPADRIREAGLRVTGSRLAILDELERCRTHPNAWDLYGRLKRRHPSLSLSTVYLTVEAFMNAGLVRRLPAREGRVRFDGTVEPHDHAVCVDCGEIFDIPPRPPARQAGTDLPDGLTLVAVRTEYDVLCARCQRTRTRAGG